MKTIQEWYTRGKKRQTGCRACSSLPEVEGKQHGNDARVVLEVIYGISAPDMETQPEIINRFKFRFSVTGTQLNSQGLDFLFRGTSVDFFFLSALPTGRSSAANLSSFANPLPFSSDLYACSSRSWRCLQPYPLLLSIFLCITSFSNSSPLVIWPIKFSFPNHCGCIWAHKCHTIIIKNAVQGFKFS